MNNKTHEKSYRRTRPQAPEAKLAAPGMGREAVAGLDSASTIAPATPPFRTLLSRLAALVLLLLVDLSAAATDLEVIHKKKFLPDDAGVLHITEEGIHFEARDQDKSRRWRYRDIEFLNRVSSTEIILRSYESRGLPLGGDKKYRFLITSGSLTEARFAALRDKVGKPAANRSFAEPDQALREIAAKHHHRFGGCEGRLIFTESEILYVSENESHSRQWRLEGDVESVWSADPYQLEVHAWEGAGRSFSKTRAYQFSLKRPLDPEFFRQLKIQLYGLKNTTQQP